jgi:RNA polymerase sigma-70 factor (ECF subfamily)
VSAEEAELLDALRRGDEDAFGRLVAEHHQSLRRLARLYLANAAVADEVVQDTWLGVIRGLWAFEGRSSLKTWIFRILANRAKTRAVRERRTLPLSAFEPERIQEPALPPERFRGWDDPRWPGHWAVPPAAWPEDKLLAAETRERLAAAIDALPGTQRAVISLRDLEGWSAEEVCNALELSETNQRVLLHRARAKVRKVLEDYLT